jgi:hypothetical protein
MNYTNSHQYEVILEGGDVTDGVTIITNTSHLNAALQFAEENDLQRGGGIGVRAVGYEKWVRYNITVEVKCVYRAAYVPPSSSA